MDGAGLYLQPQGQSEYPYARTGKHRMTQLIHLGNIMTAELERVWEMVVMNDCQSAAPSYSKQSPSPRRPDASYMPLREKWMNGPLWNKWSLSAWHLQMNHSRKTKSFHLFYYLWRCVFAALELRTAGLSKSAHTQRWGFKKCINSSTFWKSCAFKRRRRGKDLSIVSGKDLESWYFNQERV